MPAVVTTLSFAFWTDAAKAASLKLPKPPVPNTTVMASGAPLAPLLIHRGASRIICGDGTAV